MTVICNAIVSFFIPIRRLLRFSAIVGVLVIYAIISVVAPLWRWITKGWAAVVFGLIMTMVVVWGLQWLGVRYLDRLLRFPTLEALIRGDAPAPDAPQKGAINAGFFGRILGLYLLTVLLWTRQRDGQQLIVDEFTDLTSGGSGEKVGAKGLASLLVAQLSRIRALYEDVDEQRTLTTETGPHQSLSATMGVDDLSSSLTAVSSDSSISFGSFKVPLGAIVSLVGRLLRAPRIIGSLHGTADGLVLIARHQRGAETFTWRVDSKTWLEPPDVAAPRTIDDLIAELACRIFADLALSGTVRWRAAWFFTCGLREYRECLRTPRDRRQRLRKVESKFIEALSDDEAFGLAYYDLGVVYAELKERPAAAAAFSRAAARNPQLWSPPYALASHRFEDLRAEAKKSHAPFPAAHPRRRLGYEEVIVLCARTRRLGPPLIARARAWELEGLVYRDLAMSGSQHMPLRGHERLDEHWNDWRNASRAHTHAVLWSVATLSLALFRAGGPRDPSGEKRDRARQLAANCFRSLASVHLDRSVFAAGEVLFAERGAKWYLRVAAIIDRDVADSRFNIARIYHKLRRLQQARVHYERVGAMDPERPGVRAYLAAVLPRREEAAAAWSAFLDTASGLSRRQLASIANDIRSLTGSPRRPRRCERRVIKKLRALRLLQNQIDEDAIDDAVQRKDKLLRSRLLALAQKRDRAGQRWHSGMIWFALGRFHYIVDEYELAAAALDNAIERLAPRFPNTLARTNAGSLRMFCLAHLVAVQLRDLGDAGARQLLLAAQARLKRAMNDARCPVTANPISPELYHYLGGAFFELGDADNEHALVEAGQLWAPEDYRIRLNHAETHRQLAACCADPAKWLSHMNDSVAIYREALADINPRFLDRKGRTHIRLAHVLYSKNDVRAAVNHFRQARALGLLADQDLHWRAWLGLGAALRASDQLDEATVELTRLIKELDRLDKDPTWSKDVLVDEQFGVNDEPQYRQELNILAHVLLSHVHLDRGGDLGQADWEFQCAQTRLSTVSREDARVRCVAASVELEGRLRLAQDRVSEAIEKLRYSARLRGNAETYLRLAQAYARTPRNEAAVRDACNQVIRLDRAGRFKGLIEQLCPPPPSAPPAPVPSRT